MRENDGRKLDKMLEDIRVRSVHQIVEEQARVADVTNALGFPRSTVFAWVKVYRAGGPEALAATPIPGRPQKLTDEQVRQVYAVLPGTDPRQLGFEVALRTRWMVSRSRSPTVRRSGDRAVGGAAAGPGGVSPPRPVVRGDEQDPEAVRQGKTVTSPALRAEAAQAGATL